MSRPHIAVIIPSALRTIPGTDTLWLRRALQSVGRQTFQPKEIIVGLDPGVTAPMSAWESFACLKPDFWEIFDAHGNIPGHQAACNAAAAAAKSPLLAFLEDDDTWAPSHLEALVNVMDQTGADFVSTSQLEVDPSGKSRGTVFSFPTASGWLMKRLTWLQLGGFNTRFRIHHDTDFLGRLNAAKVPRAHIVGVGCDLGNPSPHVQNVARNARLVKIKDLTELTVRRTVHAESILGTMRAGNEERIQRSMKEHACLEVLYGDLADTW